MSKVISFDDAVDFIDHKVLFYVSERDSGTATGPGAGMVDYVDHVPVTLPTRWPKDLRVKLLRYYKNLHIWTNVYLTKTQMHFYSDPPSDILTAADFPSTGSRSRDPYELWCTLDKEAGVDITKLVQKNALGSKEASFKTVTAKKAVL